MLNLEALTAAQARNLGEISREFEPQYLEMLDEVRASNGGSLAWWLSSLASRDPNRSPCFERCCKLILVKKYLSFGTKMIYTHDSALALVIRNLILKEGRECEVRTLRSYREVCKDKLRPWMILFGSIRFLFQRFLSKKTPRKNDSPIILLDMCVSSDSNTGAAIENGKYNDRYFTGWDKYLSHKEKAQVYFLPTLIFGKNLKRVIRSIRECNDPFLIPDDYLKWHDYIWIIGQMLKTKSLKLGKVSVEGIPVLPFLEDEIRTKFSDWSGVTGLLSYRFAQRSAEAGLKVKRLIDWSENQAVDRGLVLGFNHFHPKTKVVAYKPYMLAEGPHLCPSANEVLAQVHPQEAWVIGRGYRDELNAMNSGVKVNVGPALRDNLIFDENRECNERANLLVGLPIGANDCKGMLALIYEFTSLIPKGLQINIKPHPFMPREALIQSGAVDHPNWAWVEGDFVDHLSRARLLCTNGSSTAMQALAAGVPVLLLGSRQSITRNPIPKNFPEKAWALCFSAEESATALSELLECSPDFMQNVARKTLEEYFSKPNVENVRALLGLTGGEH